MRPSSSLFLLLIIGLATGCATTTRVQVAQQVSLDCGAEPFVPLLVLKPVKPVAVYALETDNSYVRFEVEDYENSALNMKRIVRHFEALSAIIVSYRQCIEDFNAPQEPPSEP